MYSANEINLDKDFTIKPRVLVVDDNKLIQVAHKTMLMTLGCEVDIASSGEEALSMVENDYDVILLDLELPGINGSDVAIGFSQYPCRDKSRIIVITSCNSYNSFEENCFFFGIEQVLSKPIDIKKLEEIIFQSADCCSGAGVAAYSRYLKVSKSRASNWYNKLDIKIPYEYVLLTEELTQVSIETRGHT